MSDFEAIDALLASVTDRTELPEARVRGELREQAGLSKAKVARALGVSPSTVAAWEAGRDPAGEIRAKYAYLLDGLAAGRHAEPEPDPERESAAEPTPAPAPNSTTTWSCWALPSRACCAGHRVAGFAQHLDAAECRRAAPAEPKQPQHTKQPYEAKQPQAARRPREGGGQAAAPARLPAVEGTRRRDRPRGPGRACRPRGRCGGGHGGAGEEGDPGRDGAARRHPHGGRYDVSAHPWMPDILKKRSSRGSDQVGEARPKWTRDHLPPGAHEVTTLDINGAYLSALKTHLSIGQLEHTAGTGFDHGRRRAGVHLITPPHGDHEDVLPNPLGRREEAGPLWVTEPTVRLLLPLSGPKYGLCDPPEIHESYTSGATENLLEKFRAALKDARDKAIEDGDEVTLEYVKAMYAKFVSTLGSRTTTGSCTAPTGCTSSARRPSPTSG
ncbi:helix-turn-helix domain-containing protein [Streptomyces mirabilis]|uniref:helix-turn-helix domain-containing protein n=1 Tax=Streptomyces mirabilis TaxID=68239 RepID=UPI0033BE45EF